jgi:hypothetical protein
MLEFDEKVQEFLSREEAKAQANDDESVRTP